MRKSSQFNAKLEQTRASKFQQPVSQWMDAARGKHKKINSFGFARLNGVNYESPNSLSFSL